MSTMTQNKLVEQLLREAIDTFKKLLSPADIAEANAAWADETKSHVGQLALLEAAKEGDVTAVNYLYLQMIPQVSSVFWNNFLGKDPRYRRQRISQGEHLAFASMVYEVLLSASIQTGDEKTVKARMKSRSGHDDVDQAYEDLMGTASPLRTFDPDVFDENTNLIQKFGFYLIGALKNESIKYNRKERRGGLTGKRGKDDVEDVKNVSYEAHFDSNDEHAHDFDDFANTENLDSWSQFVGDGALDAGKTPTARDVLRDFLAQEENFNVSVVADKYGATNQTIRNRLGGMADILKKHGIDQQAFGQLLKTHGGRALAAQL
jgi:hypothetical protein